MSHARAKLVRFGLASVVAAAAAACSAPPPPPSVEDLMHDRIALDGIIMKCSGIPRIDRTNPDCAVARIAIDRLAERRDAADAAKREAEFEQLREELRLGEEQHRLERENERKVDAYTLPLVPIEPLGPKTAANAATASSVADAGAPRRSPLVGQTQH